MVWGVIAVAGASAALDAWGQYEAGKDAESRAKQNAANLYAESTENIRKTKLSQEQTVAQTEALQGAMGVSMKSESVITYMDAMQENFKKDLTWMERAREMGVKTELQRGKDIKEQAKWGAAASVVGGASKVASVLAAPKVK